MSEEWLDIVDTDDRVVGRATRDRIHQERHLHRSTHIVLFNSRDQVFVQLRSMSKDNNPGLWDTSAAGHVDSGESYLDCAVRELYEELGVHVESSELQAIGRLLPEQRNGFEFTEIYRVCTDQDIVLQEEEIADGRWVTIDELETWMNSRSSDFTDAFRLIWSMVRTG